MKTKIKQLIVLVLLTGASVLVMFALGNALASNRAQAEPDVSVPSAVSTDSDNGGMRTRADFVVPSARYGSRIDMNQFSAVLPPMDVRSVTMEAPNQIGSNRSVAVSPNTQPQKLVNADGSQLVVLIIKSSGASGIGLHFRDFDIPPDAEVYVYGPATDSIVCGPYTDRGPWGTGEFWSATIPGDTAIVEFYSKSGDSGKGFEIFEVSHIFPELGGSLLSEQPDATPLPCEVDASCFSDAEKNAVARILFNNNGARVCTGTLLNDCAQNHIPYFLTANHCVSTQGVAQTVEVFWFYRTTSCNSGVLRNWVHSPPGATLLVGQHANDFALLRLQNNAPAGAVFSGWTSAVQSIGTGVFGLHHPQGYLPPSVNSYLRRTSGNITSTGLTCSDSGLLNGLRADWTSGTNEPGSSGSGIWNSSHRLIGVQSCGPIPPTCNGPHTLYGQFANFYSQIRPFLCSGNAGAVAYDFNNDAHPDFLLSNGATRQTAMAYLNNNVVIGAAFGPTLPSGWQVVGVADFNRDGHPDYLLFNTMTRGVVIWHMNNNVHTGGGTGPSLPGGWSVVALGDFNEDGFPDCVLYNASTRRTVVWYMRDNVRFASNNGPTLVSGWVLVSVADFNGDGDLDYLLFRPSTGQSVIWYLSGLTRSGSRSGPTIPKPYQLMGVADFDDNGKPDYVLYNPSTFQTAIWYLNDNVLVRHVAGPTLPGGWNLAAP
jgi:FG-GAP-like repeat/Trypsin-like peptidase domain